LQKWAKQMTQLQLQSARLRLGDPAPDAVVRGPDGSPVYLSSLWAVQPLVLAFLRHFGCPFCRRALAALQAAAPEIAARGARIAAVTMAAPGEAASYCGARAPNVLCLADEERRAFRAYGLGRASGLDVLRPDVVLEGFRATIAGHLPGVPVGDPWQMPGTFVIGADGRIRLAHYSRTVADNPDPALILVALPEADRFA
jgi:peroxiredoxin